MTELFFCLCRAVYQLQRKCMVGVMRYEYLSVDQQAVRWIIQEGDWRRGWNTNEQNTLSHHIFILFYPFSHHNKCQALSWDVAHMTFWELLPICIILKEYYNYFSGSLEANEEKKTHCICPLTTWTVLYSAVKLILLVQFRLWYCSPYDLL